MRLLALALLLALVVVATAGSKKRCGKGGSYCPGKLVCVQCGKTRCCKPRKPVNIILCAFHGQSCGKNKVCISNTKGGYKCVRGRTLKQCRAKCTKKWQHCSRCNYGYCCKPKKCRKFGQQCGLLKVCVRVGALNVFICVKGLTKGQCHRRCNNPWKRCAKCKNGYCCVYKKCRKHGQVCGKSKVCVRRGKRLVCVKGLSKGQCRKRCRKNPWKRCKKCSTGYCCKYKKCRRHGQVCGRYKVCVYTRKGYKCVRGKTKSQCRKKCRKNPWYHCVRCNYGYCCKPKCSKYGEKCGKNKVCVKGCGSKGYKCVKGLNKKQCKKRCKFLPWKICVRCKRGYCCVPKKCVHYGQVCGKYKVCVSSKKGFKCVKGLSFGQCKKGCKSHSKICVRCKRGYCCVYKKCYKYGQICGKGRVCVSSCGKKGFKCVRGKTKRQCKHTCKKNPWYHCVRCKFGYCCKPKCTKHGHKCGKLKVCVWRNKRLVCVKGKTKRQCTKSCRLPWKICVKCTTGYCCVRKKCRRHGQRCGKYKVCVRANKGYKCVKGKTKRQCKKSCRVPWKICVKCKTGYCCVRKKCRRHGQRCGKYKVCVRANKGYKCVKGKTKKQCKSSCKNPWKRCFKCNKGYCCKYKCSKHGQVCGKSKVCVRRGKRLVCVRGLTKGRCRKICKNIPWKRCKKCSTGYCCKYKKCRKHGQVCGRSKVCVRKGKRLVCVKGLTKSQCRKRCRKRGCRKCNRGYCCKGCKGFFCKG